MANAFFPNLFRELTIRGHIYRNRIETAPTMFAQACLMPGMHDPIMHMIESRAKGGQAAVILGEVGLNDCDGASLHIAPVNYYDKSGIFFDVLKEYAERIHMHGAIAIGEICHEGQFANEKLFDAPWGSKDKNTGPDAYGPVNMKRPDGGIVEAFSLVSMKRFCEELEAGCAFFRAAGFDGVMLHGGHGFIIQQFISPIFNTRTDEYGGSMKNRSRFPKKMFEAMRKGLGEDGILQIRMSAEDMLPGGMTLKDTMEFAHEIDGMVDIFQVSCGIKSIGNRTQTFSDMYDPHGVNVERARAIKSVLKRTKVAVVGGLNSPEQMEDIITSGAADLVTIGRQAFADPEFANKAQAGRADEIRRCVRCFQCYPGQPEHESDIQFLDRSNMTEEEFQEMISPASMGRCAINPYSNFRLDMKQYPAPKESRRVLVIGGGVAGLQAAITASERGHRVTLLEKKDHLGGILSFTDRDNLKKDLYNLKEEMIREAQRKVWDIRLNTEFTESLLQKLNPDHVLICTGSEEVLPDINGSEYMTDVLDVYKETWESDYQNESFTGKKAVIIGGGSSGCETGLYLREEKGMDVTILKRGGRLAPECTGSYRAGMIDEMDRVGVKYHLGLKIVKIEANGVFGYDSEGREQFYPADLIVNACGRKPISTEQIRKHCEGIPCIMLGDCKKIAKVGNAIADAAITALKIY